MEHLQQQPATSAAAKNGGCHSGATAKKAGVSLRSMFDKTNKKEEMNGKTSSSPTQKPAWNDNNSVGTAETSTSTSVLSSPSSTFSIRSDEEWFDDVVGPKVNPISTSTNKGTCAYSVRFREDLNIFYENDHEEDQEESKERWYCAEDYVEFRCFSAYIAGSVIDTASKGAQDNMANSFIGLMLKSYWICCSNDTAEDGVDTTMPLFTKPEMELLRQIYYDTGGAVLVGLERHIARQIAADIRDRRSELVCMAEAIQESDSTKEELEAELEQACRELSRASKLFARHMALVLMEI